MEEFDDNIRIYLDGDVMFTVTDNTYDSVGSRPVASYTTNIDTLKAIIAKHAEMVFSANIL